MIGTASSVVALVGTAFTLFQEIRKAREKIRGAPRALHDISEQLESLEKSLGFVRAEEGLQTAGVEQQVRAITKVADELKSSLDRLAAEQQRKAVAQFIHAVKSGDKDDRELQAILGRLDSARDELVLRISVAQVGLMGNLDGGFRVAFNVLTETNRRVNEVLGINLALVDWLKTRSLSPTGIYEFDGDRGEQADRASAADGMITLGVREAEELGLTGPQRDATRDAATAKSDETSIYGNTMSGQARIMTGNIGVENWQRVPGRKTTIANNQFGNDVRIMTGDQGGPAAERFNDNFWN